MHENSVFTDGSTETLQSCQAKIQSRMKFLTRTEAKVAAYVLANYQDIFSCTVTELAEKTGTSEASIVRFCKSIGCKGFYEFKIYAAKDSIPRVRHPNPDLEMGDSADIVCRKIFSSVGAVLNETLMTLDMSMLDKVAEAVRPTGRIVFFGSGGSALVGVDAQHKFLKIGVRCSAHLDADMQAMEASLMKKGEVAIGISHSGSNRNVVQCMKIARQQGGVVVALTTQGKSPMLRYADISLITATKETIFKSESVSARIAQLAVIDALVACVAFKNYDGSFAAIQKTRMATSSGKY